MTDRIQHKKTVYMTAKRQPTIEGWRMTWRRHAALAMSRPFWQLITKHSQCDVVHEAPFGTDEHYDGVGLCWQTPGLASGINGMTSDPEGVRLMIEDEKVVFGIYVGDISVITVETVLKQGSGAAYKLFLRLYRESDDFDEKLITFGEALLADAELAPLLRRLSVGLVEADEYTKNSSLDFDGLIELSVDSLDAARAVMESPRLKAVAELFSGTIRADWRLIVTKENMFWDPEFGIDERQRLIRDYPPAYYPPVPA